MTGVISPSSAVPHPLEISTRGQDWLRLTAVALMLIDHLSKTLVADPSHLGHLLGRPAFPLFVFLIAYHCERHATNPLRYLLPMLVFGLLAAVPYAALFGGANIMLTLALGVIACAPWRVAFGSLAHLAVAICMALWAVVFGANYGAFGVLLFVAARAVVRSPSLGAWAVFGACAVLANGSLLGLTALASIGLVIALADAPGSRLRLGRWWAYWIYPLHLWAILGAYALRG